MSAPPSRASADAPAFAATMPAGYRASFGLEEITKHAEVAAGRGAAPTHVEVCGDEGGAPSCLCVVATDAPGMLPKISAALVAHDIDIVSADVFRRLAAGGEPELLDVLRVRRASDPTRALEPGVEQLVAKTLARLVEEQAPLDAMRPPPSVRPTPRGGYDVTFRFEDDEAAGTTTLSIEATDSPGLLLVVTRALFRADLQIVGLRATTREGTVIDRFELSEPDGRPVQGARRFELQTALLAAIEDARSGAPPESDPYSGLGP
jgi:UTP:GlnB (protein PII) uridylyltransferase